jgi:MerR family transcriptional regulator, light-induced transcriptional regulator
VDEAAYLRIGELSRRTGVARELLRAWERRYGLLRPQRTEGGFRLYSHDDVRRVQAMREHLANGVSAAQAAALAVSGAPAADAARPRAVGTPAATAVRPAAEGVEALDRAFESLDDAAAQSAFDALLARHSLDGVLRDFIVPYLRELGARWERGAATVAQEHFASALLRGRLFALARGWDQGLGPRALLACAPGEQHELSLIAFGLALRSRGWRITYLGADTPLESVAEIAETIAPQIVVLVAITSPALTERRDALAALGARWPLALAGAAAGDELARAAGARLLAGDPVTEAEVLTGERWP